SVTIKNVSDQRNARGTTISSAPRWTVTDDKKFPRGGEVGALGEIRTPDPRNRNPMLYPAELRALTLFVGLAPQLAAFLLALLAAAANQFVRQTNSHLAACFSSLSTRALDLDGACSQPIQLRHLKIRSIG